MVQRISRHNSGAVRASTIISSTDIPPSAANTKAFALNAICTSLLSDHIPSGVIASRINTNAVSRIRMRIASIALGVSANHSPNSTSPGAR